MLAFVHVSRAGICLFQHSVPRVDSCRSRGSICLPLFFCHDGGDKCHGALQWALGNSPPADLMSVVSIWQVNSSCKGFQGCWMERSELLLQIIHGVPCFMDDTKSRWVPWPSLHDLFWVIWLHKWGKKVLDYILPILQCDFGRHGADRIS